MDIPVQNSQSVRIFITKYSVRGEIFPVQNIQSVWTFQYKIVSQGGDISSTKKSSQYGYSITKYSVRGEIFPVQKIQSVWIFHNKIFSQGGDISSTKYPVSMDITVQNSQ
jgi:hypothetical protein